MESQDMDDFVTPPRRGQSRDKGKGKTHVPEPARHSVSGRPGVTRMDDVSYEKFASFLRFSLYDALTPWNRRTWTTSSHHPDVDTPATRARERLTRLRPADVVK